MSQVERQELDQFRSFYRRYYDDDIASLAQEYPGESRSLYVDYDDLYRFDTDLAERYLTHPEELREVAEEALRTYDLPADVALGQAHVRLRGLPASNAIDIRSIRVVDDHIGSMVTVQGIVRKATDVRPKIVEAAFECQRCGTMTYIPQSDSGFQEPHECQGCERQGPFRINHDQSEFVDAQTIRVQESPEGLRGGETPQAIDVYLEDDVCGHVTPGDHVSVAGVLHIEQQSSGNEKSAIFDLYMDGVTVEIEDEQFEDMEIADEDVTEILKLSDRPDIYEQMVGSVAPSIYGYEQEKLAMILQLFSGVTKELPDETRIRGDLHMLLIGDPGTGKSQLLSYIQNIAPRSVYTSGKGSSSAGLTAAAVRDDFGDGQQWTLEAGALVLADQGIAAVDELDKMRCVTGETLVHLGDGTVRRIGELAREAASDGEIEELSNGRTIRDVEAEAWTMTEDGSLVTRPVTAIHEYEAPETLVKVTLETGETVTATRDHPFFIETSDGRKTKAAGELQSGDETYVPRSPSSIATDGGTVADDLSPDSRSEPGDVVTQEVRSVESVPNSNKLDVYDLTVEGTHNFVANGMIVHNSEDRSAMHEALEQQKISISKAGINATLKSRCSLLGAANPKYGRFDQYEPIGEQIDLEPALISRFDLIFTVTDQPDPDHDARLAEHILTTNYAGELNTQHTELANAEVTRGEVESVQDEVAPEVQPELLRKYIAYAKRNCYPRMTDEARAAIRDFYVDLRAEGADEDAPVPVTARKLEALVRLAEASARVRLSDTVEESDAERVIEIVRSCLQDIGVDPETGEFDADVVETGTSKSQRDRIKNLKGLIEELADEYDDEPGAPVEQVIERADEAGTTPDKAEQEIESLKRKGEVYEPGNGYLRTT